MNVHTILSVMERVWREVDADHSLVRLSEWAGRSPYHLHRRFTAAAGETPKQFSQRVRLDRGVTGLISDDRTITEIAFDCEFESPEVFARAFKRRFGITPSAFRRRWRTTVPDADRAGNVRALAQTSPCLGLYRMRLDGKNGGRTMPSKVEPIVIDPQPILFIQRRIPPTQLQATMAECFGKLYGYGQGAGLAIAGQPIARYVATGTGSWTVDFVMPLAQPAEGSDEMQPGMLHGGAVARAVHMGPYELLSETNAAIERWVEENGREPAGAPWEVYVTDPAQTPNPEQWRTDVYWPLVK